MRYELTSKYGWVPGKRGLRRLADGSMEQPLLLLHVDGMAPIEVAHGTLAFSVRDRLVCAGATEYKYDGPGRCDAAEPKVLPGQ